MPEEDNLYPLLTKISQDDFYHLIAKMKDHDFSFSVKTKYSNLKTENMNREEFDISTILQIMQSQQDIFRFVGFLTIGNIEITSVTFTKENTEIEFHPYFIRFTEGKEKLKNILNSFSTLYVWIKNAEGK